MKKLIFLFNLVIFSGQFINSNEIETLSEKIKKEKPSKLCFGHIFSWVKNLGGPDIIAEIGDEDLEASASSIFSVICMKNPVVNTTDDSITLTGDTTFKETPINGKIRLTKTDKFHISFAAEISGQQEFKFEQINKSLAPVDSLFEFEKVIITYSDIPLKKALFGDKLIDVGLTISGNIKGKGFAKSLGILSSLITINLPVSKNGDPSKDISFNFEPNLSKKGICPSEALIQLITNPTTNKYLKFTKNDEETLKNLLNNYLKNKETKEEYCFHTDVGLVMNKNSEPVFYVMGDFDVNQKKYRMMIKLTMDSNDDLILTLGFQPPTEILTLEQLTTLSAFSPIDAIFKLSEPLITYSNRNDQTLFDIDMSGKRPKINPKLEGIVKVNEGLQISANVHGQGILKNSGFEHINTIITIPTDAISKKDPSTIKIVFKPKDKLCLANIINNAIAETKVGIDALTNPLINKFTTCFKTDSDQFNMQVVFDKEKNAIFFIRGPVDDGKEGMIRIQGTDFTAAIVSTATGLSVIDKSLEPLDSLLSVSNPILAYSNIQNGIIFDLGKGDAKKALVKKGVNLLAPTGGDIANKLDIDDVNIAITSKDTNIKTSIDLISRNNKPTCLSAILGPLSEVTTKLFGDVCLERKSISAIIHGKNAYIKYDGTINTSSGQKLNATLFADSKGTNKTVFTLFAQSEQIDIAKILSGSILNFVNNLISLNLNNPIFAIATEDTDRQIDPKTGNVIDLDDIKITKEKIEPVTVKKGVSIYSNLKFNNESLVGKSLAYLGLDDVNGYFRLLDSNNLTIRASKPINKTVADMLTLKESGLEIRIEKGTTFAALDVDSIIDKRNVKLKGGIDPIKQTILLEGSIKGLTEKEPVQIDLHPIPLKVTNPELGIYILGGEPIGFKIKGKYDFGVPDRTIIIDADVNLVDATKSLIYFNVKTLCITDQYKLLFKLMNNINKKLDFNVPPQLDFLCLDDVVGSFNLSDLNVSSGTDLYETWVENTETKTSCSEESFKSCDAFCKSKDYEEMLKAKCEKEKLYCLCKEKYTGTKKIPVGIRLKGKAKLNLPGITNTGNLELELSPSGIKGNGSLEKIIDIGGVIKVTAADNETLPPKMGISIPPTGKDKDQVMWIDGQARIGQLAATTTRMYLTTKGFEFDTQTKFLEFNSVFSGNIAFEQIGESKFSYKIEETGLLTTKLADNVKLLNKDVASFQADANAQMASIKKGCGTMPLLSDICKGLMTAGQATLDATVPLFNEVTKQIGDVVSGLTGEANKVFWINYIEFKGNLQALQKGGNLFTVIVDYNLLNKFNQKLELNLPIPKDMAEFVNSLIGPIYENILKPFFGIIMNQIQNLIIVLKNFVGNLGGVISAAAGTAAAGGNVIYSAGKLIFTLSPDSAKELVSALEDYGNNISKLVSNIADTLGDLFQDLGKSIVSLVEDVSKAVVDAANIVAKGIESGAIWVGKTIEKLALDLADALNLDKIFNPKNWG